MKYTYGEAVSVSAGEISRNFGLWQDKAVAGPVIVTHHGRPRVVLLSADQYATFQCIPSAPDGSPLDLAFETALSAVLDNTTEAFISFDHSLNVTAINRVFESMFGQIASHVVGRAFDAVFPLAAQSVIGEQLRRALKTGEVIEFFSPTTTENQRYYAYRAFPYPDGIAVLIVNQTAEREFRIDQQNASALRLALSGLPSVCAVYMNVRNVICGVDASFAALSGFSKEELMGFRLTDVVLPKDRPEVTQVLEEVLQMGAPRTFRMNLLVKGQAEQLVEVSAAPIVREAMCEGIAVVLTPVSAGALSPG